MPYASEADYRAAVVAYRALHEVFYRFHKRVRGQRADLALADCAADEGDYAALVGECLPALSKVYAGPPEYLERLGDTLKRLGDGHAASKATPFDPQLVHQAYIDVDNVLQDLLREREHYPDVFDSAFTDGDARPGTLTRRSEPR